MEGNTGQENTRSCSNTSAVTAANVKQQQSSSSNCNLQAQDDSRAWTDEKHNSYLNHLEMSFVTQLNQSKEQPPPVRCSVRNQPSNGQFVDTDDGSDQFTIMRNGRWLKIKYQRSVPFTPYKTSLAGSKSREVYSPPSADSRKVNDRCNTEKHDKVGLLKCSPKFSYSPSYGDSTLSMTEGTGQNFCDEEDHIKASIGYPTKRLRTTSADCSVQDHIVPSQNVLEKI